MDSENPGSPASPSPLPAGDSRDPSAESGQPWGFWATIGLSLPIVVVFIVVQSVVAALYFTVVSASAPGVGFLEFLAQAESDGLFISLATIASAGVCGGLPFLFAGMRKTMSARRYLALEWVHPVALAKWLGLLVLFVAASDTLTFLLGRPVVSQFQIDAYATARGSLLLWFAFVVAAPLFEELMFRGFLFRGFEKTRIGTPGAIMLTALAWALPHFQYDAYQVGTLFAGGLLLGMARARTASTVPALAMHSLQNVIALVETIVFLQRTGAAS